MAQGATLHPCAVSTLLEREVQVCPGRREAQSHLSSPLAFGCRSSPGGIAPHCFGQLWADIALLLCCCCSATFPEPTQDPLQGCCCWTKNHLTPRWHHLFLMWKRERAKPSFLLHCLSLAQPQKHDMGKPQLNVVFPTHRWVVWVCALCVSKVQFFLQSPIT